MQPERPEPPRQTDFAFDPPQITATETVDVKSVIPGPRGDALGDDLGAKVGPAIFRTVDLDGVPRVRSQTAPTYPFEAKSRGLSGEVLVEFSVDENGAAFDLRVVRSSDRIFEEAALRAVARWKFEPGRRDGRIVRFKMSVPIVFRLDEN
jgi:protein TonB